VLDLVCSIFNRAHFGLSYQPVKQHVAEWRIYLKPKESTVPISIGEPRTPPGMAEAEKIQPTPIKEPPAYESSDSKVVDSSDLTKLEQELGRDDALLASLGYKAELKREFTPLEVFGLAFSIMGLLPSIASTLFFSMPAGGPVGMVLFCHKTYF